MSKSPVHRHLPFLIGFAAGIATSIILWVVHPNAALVGGAITFFLIYLIHTATRLPYLTAAHMKTYAASDDEPAGIILLITFGAAAVGGRFIVPRAAIARRPTRWSWRCRSPRSRSAGSPSTQ